MAMRHVRQREHRKRCNELEARLQKKRLSRTDEVLLIISRYETSSDCGKGEKETSPKPRKKTDNFYAEYGISARGREKIKGKSKPVRELLDYCPSKFNKLV